MAGSWANETDVAQAIGNDPARAAAIIAGELTQAKVDTLEDLRHDTPASPERDIETLLRARDNSGKRRDLQRALHSLGRAACDTSTEETAIQATLDTIPEN